MTEAGPSGEHQAAGAPNDDGNAPFRVPVSVTQTEATELRILLFNVSGANKAAGMPEAQIEGIKRVLNSEELALDKFSTFIFCSDKVTNPKKRVFYEILQTSSPTRNENAAIFYNKMAESRFRPEYVCDIPSLPAYLELRQQNQEAKRHIERAGVKDKLISPEQLRQKTLPFLASSPMRSPSYESTQEFRDDCLGRVEVACITCPHNDTQRGLRILLASWHGPHTGKTAEEKQDYFQRIVRFIEDVKTYRQTDVAVLGGDFNLDTDLARDGIENLRSQLPDIELLELPDEKLMYTVVCPAGYLELRPDFPKIIGLNAPTATVHDSGLPPFNHPVLLFRFGVRSDQKGQGTGGVLGRFVGRVAGGVVREVCWGVARNQAQKQPGERRQGE